MRAKKILLTSIGIALLISGISFFLRPISDFVYYNHSIILAVSVVILMVMLAVQYKHTAILRENERLYEELKRKQAHIDRDMSMARSVQQGLLQKKLPVLHGCKIAAGCRPAAKIGGDFYGVKTKNNKIHFFLGDVAGHGISSALVMALTEGLLRELLNTLDDPAQIIENLNVRLAEYLQDTISFVTLFYVCYEPRIRKLTYISAGQHPALLFRGGKLQDKIQTGGSLLGMFTGCKFTARSLKLQKGDKLICYTDGFTEARNAAGEELGEEFIIDGVQKFIAKPVEKIKTELYALIEQEAQAINDDLSLLCFEAA